MTFHSILFADSTDGKKGQAISAEPGFFHDLNLDQIVEAITAGWQEYDLKPFFHSRLHDLPSITYRHEVMRDLENEPLFQSIKTFANQMRA
ncbi:MAG: DNA mismatch repair protein MutS, partial [Lacunisphaera sp.]